RGRGSLSHVRGTEDPRLREGDTSGTTADWAKGTLETSRSLASIGRGGGRLSLEGRSPARSGFGSVGRAARDPDLDGDRHREGAPRLNGLSGRDSLRPKP